MKNEIWKPVIRYKGRYEVSNLGRVKSLYGKWGIKRNLILKPGNCGGNKCRYLSVVLYKNRKGKTKLIHQIVLESFKGKNKNKECCHNDGNPKNNNLENLRYDSRKQNHADKIKHRTHMFGISHPRSKLNENDVIYIRSLSNDNSMTKFLSKKLATKFNVSVSTIQAVVHRKNWKHI